MNFPEIKDRRRIRDIYDSDRQIGLAIKMAKLITDSKKAERRWRAAIDLFGSSHSVTQIFNQRMRELTGSTTTISLAVTTATTAPSTENKTKKERTPKTETKIESVEVVLNRSKKDFPVGCTVKNKNTDRKGVVSAHDSEDLNVVIVQFEDENVEVNIYLLKRA